MTQYYVAIRSAIKRSGPIRMVPLEQVHLYTGFRTIVAYDEETAEEILEADSLRNMRGCPVYADTLFIDFDDYDPVQFINYLQDKGYAYEAYHSGGRSVHIHIPIHPIFGPTVPGSLKAWVKKHAAHADLSFYHAAGQYRLPGTFHKKNPGKFKQLIDMQEGRPLDIPLLEKKQVMPISVSSDSTPEQFLSMLLEPKRPGERSTFIWLAATVAGEAGLPFEETVDKLRWWNERYCKPPHDDGVIVRQTENAYKRLTYR